VTPKVRFTPPARAQLLAALAYIRADRPSAARAFQHRVNAVLARLGDFPDSGRVVPELPDLQFREVTVEPYRFFYRVQAGLSGWSRHGMGRRSRMRRPRSATANKQFEQTGLKATMRVQAQRAGSSFAGR